MYRPLPTALLLVLYVIHDKLSLILFSENTFQVYRSDWHSLSGLLILRLNILQSMTSLSIRLNACSYVPYYQCPKQRGLNKRCLKCHFNYKLGRDFLISIT